MATDIKIPDTADPKEFIQSQSNLDTLLKAGSVRFFQASSGFEKLITDITQVPELEPVAQLEPAEPPKDKTNQDSDKDSETDKDSKMKTPNVSSSTGETFSGVANKADLSFEEEKARQNLVQDTDITLDNMLDKVRDKSKENRTQKDRVKNLEDALELQVQSNKSGLFGGLSNQMYLMAAAVIAGIFILLIGGD